MLPLYQLHLTAGGGPKLAKEQQAKHLLRKRVVNWLICKNYCPYQSQPWLIAITFIDLLLAASKNFLLGFQDTMKVISIDFCLHSVFPSNLKFNTNLEIVYLCHPHKLLSFFLSLPACSPVYRQNLHCGLSHFYLSRDIQHYSELSSPNDSTKL